MQYSQPIGFKPTPQTTGFLNFGQPYGFNGPSPFQYNGYPEIIGEGHVTSFISPDGSTQFLFMPTTQWWRSYPQNMTAGNYPYMSNMGAWFVNSIYNPIQAPGINQPCQAPSGIQYPRATTLDCDLNLSEPAFPLKFHYDNCTSTSDIHYFTPKQYNWFQIPKRCASVQVDTPIVTNKVSHQQCEVLCNKPCYCAKKGQKEQNNKCAHFKIVEDSNSQMSIQETISDFDCRKYSNEKKSSKYQSSCVNNSLSNSSSQMSVEDICSGCMLELHDQKKRNTKKSLQLKTTKPKKSPEVSKQDDRKRNNKRKSNKPPTNVQCECKEPRASDKSVTTYDDHATECRPENGQETQTVHSDSFLLRNAPNELCSTCASEIEVWKLISPDGETTKKSQSKNYDLHTTCNCTSESE